MHSKLIFIIAISVALAACRANPPRQSADTPNERTVSDARDTEPGADASPATLPQSTGGSYLAGDGPGADTPSNLHQIPDATPRNEPLHRYANRPYTVMGKNYTPLIVTGQYKERGIASWYGKKFHGQKTSIGETYDMYGMTAASTILPIPSYAKVTNLANQKSVIVRVNDRGPFLHERIIDLSYTAASKLGLVGNGQGMVEVESLKGDDNAPAPISPIYKAPIHVSALPDEPPVTSSGKVYLQLGAFNSLSGAEEFLSSMRTKLSDTGKQLTMSRKNGMFKVRIGTYSSADSARDIALKLEERLGFKPIVSLH
jgi:rare lipoprotein A